jgi:anti-sigma regulatory factor (Ser/Thr protein kinase)
MSDPELLASGIEFAAAPDAVRRARRWTTAVLARSGPGDLVDTAVLLVSELVTNAIHAAGAAAEGSGRPDPDWIGLVIIRTSDIVRIEVSDPACLSFPDPGGHSADQEGGRGMQVIAALSKRWGLHATRAGKVVWSELAVGDSSLAGGEYQAELPRRAP